jgi:hypothetical protein
MTPPGELNRISVDGALHERYVYPHGKRRCREYPIEETDAIECFSTRGGADTALAGDGLRRGGRDPFITCTVKGRRPAKQMRSRSQNPSSDPLRPRRNLRTDGNWGRHSLPWVFGCHSIRTRLSGVRSEAGVHRVSKTAGRISTRSWRKILSGARRFLDLDMADGQGECTAGAATGPLTTSASTATKT